MNRAIAIINFYNYRNIIDNILNHLNDLDQIYVFTKNKNELENKITKNLKSNVNIFIKEIPEEYCINRSKTKNYVFRYFKDISNTLNIKYLHIFEDSIEIINDMSSFFIEIEKMMTMLGINSWFNTRCDPCNYVLTKYDPRIKVVIDDKKLESIYNKELYWTSHANTLYSIYNIENILLDEMLFDERFSIPMFYIIKKFAERRNSKSDKFPFMNFYPTIEDEGNLFRHKDYPEDKNNIFSKELFKHENDLFASLNIDYHPDVNVEPVLDFINNKLLEHDNKVIEIL